MKRIISILMVVAMMLSALLAVIPASATEGEGEPSAPAPVTYKVNWKKLYDNKKMKAQWSYDACAEQNNYDAKFTVAATETQIASTAKNGGDTRSYYSTDMVDITATTQYEYVFEAKNSAATGSAGVVFAYATDANAPAISNWPHTNDNKVQSAPYFLFGAFQNDFNLGIRFAHHDAQYKLDSAATTGTGDAADGFVTYKVTYNGLNVTFSYLKDGAFEPMFGGASFALAAGAKIAFGVYSAGTNTTTVRNCVLTATNDEAAAIIANAALDEVIAVANKAKETVGYTAATATALNDAIIAAQTAKVGTDVQAKVSATEALNAIIVKLPLDLAIAKAKAIRVNDYTNGSVLTNIITTAEAVMQQENPAQATIDSNIKAINDAIAILATKKANLLYIGKTDEVTPNNYNGLGNVFYYDYHKYVAAKKYTAGVKFPTALDAAGDEGNKDYVLRMADGGNVSGTGTTRACDGVRYTYGTFSHQVNNSTIATINGKAYAHAFGYSFYKAVTVDEVAFYLPADTKIKSIDVYGAMRVTEADKTVLYGKALGEGEEAAPRVYLGTFDVANSTSASETVAETNGNKTYNYKVLKGYLTEARKVEYIYFAITFASGVGDYAINEIELYGIDNPADFTSLMAQMDIYRDLVSTDYTADTWAAVAKAREDHKAAIESVFATQAEIDAAAKALGDALKALKLATTPDKAALDAKIKEADAIVADKAKYVATTFAPFEKALAKAKTISAGNVYPQSKVNSALQALTEAMTKLVKIGVKTDLKAAIDTAKTYTKDKYNGDAMKWALFEKALKAAEAVYADEDADQLEIDDAKAELESTQSKLVASTPDEGEGEKGEAEEGENAESEIVEEEATEEATEAVDESTDAGKKKKCGSSVAVSALAIVGVIGTAVVIKKKED